MGRIDFEVTKVGVLTTPALSVRLSAVGGSSSMYFDGFNTTRLK